MAHFFLLCKIDPLLFAHADKSDILQNRSIIGKVDNIHGSTNGKSLKCFEVLGDSVPLQKKGQEKGGGDTERRVVVRIDPALSVMMS